MRDIDASIEISAVHLDAEISEPLRDGSAIEDGIPIGRSHKVLILDAKLVEPKAVQADVETRNLGNITVVAAESLHDDDMFAANTVSDPERVGLTPNDTARLTEYEVRITLPPVSWTAMTLR